MENKNKDHKPAFVSNQESQTNDAPQNKQDNALPNQQQQLPIVQWPYTPQNATEQFLAMHFPTQASPPGAFNQWQQLMQPRVFAQSAPPFWLPHPPAACDTLLGANVPGGPSSTTQNLLPNMCYHYPFPGFPCSWDPSSYMAQLYQMQHPYVYSFPGAQNFSSSTPRVPDCSASGEHSSQRGIVRPPAKLSQKHQQRWEAQSAENVQLWSVINRLQAEVSDYKDRLKKLEEEVSSFKQKAEVPTNKVIGTIPVGTEQPLKRKRGRPKKSLASVDALHESHLRADGRKPALSNPFSQSKSPFFEKVKSPIFEKVILKKVETKGIANPSTSTSCNIQINQYDPIMSAYQGQLHQGIQACGSGVNVNFGKGKDLKLVYSELSNPDKVLNNSMGVSAKYIGNTGNGNVELTSGIPCQDTAKDVLDVTRQSFIQQGGNITPGWSLNFANEEGASEDQEDAMEGSAKDENEVMEDDTSSSAEDILA